MKINNGVIKKPPPDAKHAGHETDQSPHADKGYDIGTHFCDGQIDLHVSRAFRALPNICA
jgi:hypothetical protein